MGAVLWELMAFIASIVSPRRSRIKVLTVRKPPKPANQWGTLPPSSLAVSHLSKREEKAEGDILLLRG